MTRTNWIIICLAYILGLAIASVFIDIIDVVNRSQLSFLLAVSIVLTVLSTVAIEHKIGKRIAIVLVLLCAVFYFQLRIPQPQFDDVSYQVASGDRVLVEIRGRILTEPRLSNSQRLKFWLAAREINNAEPVSGKLYATIPLLQGTGMLPGQEIDMTGYLYLPQANNSGGFDFKQYLARQGIFAGIQGTEAQFERQSSKGWIWLRQRIVRSHLKGLGSPVGQLVSSMVLGRKAVDLPREIRDRFVTAGLAHVLAASGFHVSLLLGIILKLSARIAAKPRLVLGIGTLIVYLGLTGVQASVVRACLMGSAVLLSLTMETKVKPLGSLLLAAVAILLFDPLSIGDLGFQLSFLATLGLIVTLPKLQSKLDWLPTAIATLISVPVAASIWVLPLLCYEFNTLATYSIVVNAICTPLISLISLIGMISAMVAIVSPATGSAIASILFYPTSWLIEITELVAGLPGSTWAVGQIPLIILLAIYGLFVLIWLNKWWQKRWWLGFILPLVIFFTLTIYSSAQIQIAILPNAPSPIVIVRDRGEIILINSGRENQAKYNVLPFLAQQGINQIDYGIALDGSSNSPSAWKTIDSSVSIDSIYQSATSSNLFDAKIVSRPLTETITTKSTHLHLDEGSAIVNLQTAEDTWLILGKSAKAEKEALTQYIEEHNLKSQRPIIVWSGDIAIAWLKKLQPRKAIAFNSKISPKIEQILEQKQIDFDRLATDGMIRWTPRQGFSPTEVLD